MLAPALVFNSAGNSFLLTLVLIFVAIHNAWDNVTYLVVMPRRERPADSRPPD